MKKLQRIVQKVVETPRKQIEWFGSDKFMWLVFGTFFAVLAFTLLK